MTLDITTQNVIAHLDVLIERAQPKALRAIYHLEGKPPFYLDIEVSVEQQRAAMIEYQNRLRKSSDPG